METKLIHIDREALKLILRQQNLKHYWFAEQLGVHKTTLRRWLNGRIRRLRGIHLKQMEVILDTHRDQWLRKN